jgi:F-type H+-transporting ATPase subunit b
MIGAVSPLSRFCGAAIGIGQIFAAFVSGLFRNPGSAPRVFANVILGFAGRSDWPVRPWSWRCCRCSCLSPLALHVMRLARQGLWLPAALVVLPVTAFAASGMPQLEPRDLFPQLVWLVILFAVLYVLLSSVAIPRISTTLQARDAKMSGDLAAAEKANQDARALVEAYQQRLADARANARQLTRQREEADSAAAAARLAEIGERIGAQIAEAEKGIAAQRASVLGGLEQMASEVAQSVYAKLAGQPADAGALNAKVADAMKRSGR